MKVDRPTGQRLQQIQAASANINHLCRVSARAMALLCAVTIAQPAFADGMPADRAAAEVPVVVTHSMVPTDGMITARAVRRMRHGTASRRARASQETSATWLFDYVGRLLDAEPSAARRPRPVAHKLPSAVPHPLANSGARVAPFVFAVTSQPGQPTRGVTVTQVQPPAAVPAQPVTSPITTASIIAPHVMANVRENTDELIVAAERSQLRTDLVKLEFALRTYDEQKTSGQTVFETRNDWRVLERARDALTDAELSSASGSGFEANAYINEMTRTIIVAVAGTQDLRRDLLGADIWKALVRSESPQHFYFAKTYVRSVIQRYQSQGYSTECVGHSLGGGACAYAAAELGIRALVINPISAGKLAPPARYLVTNYVVDGDIANLVYGARGHPFAGDLQVINDGRDVIRLMALERYGQLAGPILVVRELRAGINSHKASHALELIAAQAETERPR